MKQKNRVYKYFFRAGCVVFLLIGFLIFFSALWIYRIYGNIGFDAVLFTMFSDLHGVQSGLVFSYLENALLPALFSILFMGIFLLFYTNKRLVIAWGRQRIAIYPFRPAYSAVFAGILCIGLAVYGAGIIRFPVWLDGVLHTGALYEKEYAAPSEVTIRFPKQKRNLIYIYLESMETTFLSKEQGGGLPYNVMPELYSLAGDNTNFSHNQGVGGFLPNVGGTWTVGAMVSQTAGIPLVLPIDGNDYGEYAEFLPGAVSLMDILHDNGYYQALMVGSDASFGGRDKYYLQHGTDAVWDYFTAQEDGIIDKDHYVWWGMEDFYLYAYAKQKLKDMAQSDKPFAFTLLTVDTHHIGGWYCDRCTDMWGAQYENVISCASRQVNDFILWLKQQDFYEDTAVVIAGDHCSMDDEYISGHVGADYTRHVYNCFLNSSVKTDKSKGRIFLTLDMFPTTLAAMGCDIEGDRLGLGTNLFSGKETLAEQYGYERLMEEIGRRSNYYNGHILMP